MASTPLTFDPTANEWKDGDALFLRCTLWRQPAENAAETLTKGTRVIVTGSLKQRSFETKEGEKRTVVELEAEEVGPSLRYATATINRAARTDTAPAGRAEAAAATTLQQHRRLPRRRAALLKPGPSPSNVGTDRKLGEGPYSLPASGHFHSRFGLI